VACNANDGLRRSNSPLGSAQAGKSSRAIYVDEVAVGSQSTEIGNESGDAQDIVGWDNRSVKWDGNLVESSLVWISTIEPDDDGSWWGRWWWGGALDARDRVDGLRRTDDPGVGWTLDERRWVVDRVEGALGGDIDTVGRDRGDRENIACVGQSPVKRNRDSVRCICSTVEDYIGIVGAGLEWCGLSESGAGGQAEDR